MAGFLACLSLLALPQPAMAQQSSVWINPDFANPDTAGAGQVTVTLPGAGGLLPAGSPGPQRYRLPFNRSDSPVRLVPPGTSASRAPVAAVPAPALAARPVAPVLVQPAAPPRADRAPVLTPPGASATPARPTAPAVTVPAVAPSAPAAAAPVATAPSVSVPSFAATPSPAPTTPSAPKVIRPVAPAAVTAPAAAPAPVAPPTPAAEPAAPTQQVATVAPAATAATAANVTRVLFAGAAEELDDKGRAAVREIAARLKGTNDRVGVKAFADSETETQDWKRRLSLRRGQNVRRALLDEGVQSFRIVLRALGPPNDGGPGNRVDLSIESR